jgi:hypothetical protein
MNGPGLLSYLPWKEFDKASACDPLGLSYSRPDCCNPGMKCLHAVQPTHSVVPAQSPVGELQFARSKRTARPNFLLSLSGAAKLFCSGAARLEHFSRVHPFQTARDVSKAYAISRCKAVDPLPPNLPRPPRVRGTRRRQKPLPSTPLRYHEPSKGSLLGEMPRTSGTASL